MTSSNGIAIFTKNYLVQNPKGRVLLIHGLGEHCLRYAHVAAAFNEIGFDAYTFDLRGHGRSAGERAFVMQLDEFLDDIETVYQTIPKDLPLFVVGHSMGGLLTFLFLQKQKRPEVQGAVFSGAALKAGDDITPFIIFVTKIIAKFFPRFKASKLNPESISRDANTVANYQADPLIYHEGIKAALGLAMLRGFDEARTQFKDFDYPTLIMHGQADRLTNPQGSVDFYEQAGSSNKTLKIWPEAYHEIFNETNRTEVIATMIDWVQTTAQ